MGLFTNLFNYRQRRRYDSAKSRKDDRLHTGFNYDDELAPGEFISKSLSGHIQRNQTRRWCPVKRKQRRPPTTVVPQGEWRVRFIASFSS